MRLTWGVDLAAAVIDALTRSLGLKRGDARGEAHAYTARHLISSAPITELTKALSPAPASLPAAQSLRYRDFLTVARVATKTENFPDN